ncbi:hypothetical protein BGX27_007984 [Mortierella sp. AM989]|nr:hypothetical protein BGX27_007984 [Mortierella sp. AM989]
MTNYLRDEFEDLAAQASTSLNLECIEKHQLNESEDLEAPGLEARTEGLKPSRDSAEPVAMAKDEKLETWEDSLAIKYYKGMPLPRTVISHLQRCFDKLYSG